MRCLNNTSCRIYFNLICNFLECWRKCLVLEVVLWEFLGNTPRPALAASCLFTWFERRPLAFFKQGQFCSRWIFRKRGSFVDLSSSGLDKVFVCMHTHLEFTQSRGRYYFKLNRKLSFQRAFVKNSMDCSQDEDVIIHELKRKSNGL